MFRIIAIRFIKFLSITVIILVQSCSTPDRPGRQFADDRYQPKTAYEAFTELQQASTTFNARALIVKEGKKVGRFSSGVTFGGEKEGSSGLITRIMGLSSNYFLELVRELDRADQETFYRDFLINYSKDSNGHRTYRAEDGHKIDLASDVIDADGNRKLIDLAFFDQVNLETASLPELESVFKRWLDQTEGNPFSFIKPSVRRALFYGELPGLNPNFIPKSYPSTKYADYWRPLLGLPQKYIEEMHGTTVGWELGFNPQETYGQFEEMIAWFRNTLKKSFKDPLTGEKFVKLFQAPGHQRMVFNNHSRLPNEKLAEVYRLIQAYIILRGVSGNTNIEFSSFKEVHTDEAIASLKTTRGVIRLEGDRWARGTHGIEFRAGTKDPLTYQFFQTVLASRVAANDFSGINDISSWSLLPLKRTSYSSEMAQEFGLDEETFYRAYQIIDLVFPDRRYVSPLWNWSDEHSPILGAPKRELIKSLTRDFLKQVAEVDPDRDPKNQVRQLLRQWVKSSGLDEDIRSYLLPKRLSETPIKLLKYPLPSRYKVDVNKVDLGIEYSGKMPLRLQAEYSDKLSDGRKAWIRTILDIDPEERSQIIKGVAKDLLEQLGGGEGPFLEDQSGHGHGLDLAYSIRDSKNRRWVVEWDGIGRSYDEEGQVIEGSARGGSIELVTPKFNPELADMEAVFKAFEKNNILPSIQSGGGHINVDLAAFDQNPRGLARFLSLFLEHRGIISFMFQHIGRMRTAESIAISRHLAESLKDFRGSDEDLKQLLYNERYFNQRYGRKTRYSQFDLSAYYQDVIPEEFITADFDIMNPTVPWRRQFRVDPKIRKGEFRLFNAPKDALESAQMIKLVRAILSKALNEDGELSGEIQKVDHVYYLKHPQKAQRDLKNLMGAVGLDPIEYQGALAEAIAETDRATRSIFYTPFQERMAIHPIQDGWGEAVAERPEGLVSKQRTWIPGPADELNTIDQSQRIRAAQEAQRRRSLIEVSRAVPKDFQRTESCASALDLLRIDFPD